LNLIVIHILSIFRYRVNTKTNHSAFPQRESYVTRRFNDFNWLHDQLNFSFPGAIVPPLPEKQTVGRFTPEFVESRRRSLEKFIARIACHKELCNAPAFISFLKLDENELGRLKDVCKQEKEKSSKGVKGWFESKVNTLSVSNNQVKLIYLVNMSI
jgi:sorting nexin-1/2